MIEKIIRESAFDKKKKKPGLKFNPGLELTGIRTTGPCTITKPSRPKHFVGGRFQSIKILNMLQATYHNLQHENFSWPLSKSELF